MGHQLASRGYRAQTFLMFLLICLTAGGPAWGERQLSHRVALAGGGDVSLVPEIVGHGYGLVAYDLENLPADAHLGLSYNTDTLRVAFDRIRFANGHLEAGAQGTYEFVFAQLLTDYFRGGELDHGRSFNAGYFSLEAHLKANLPRDHHIELALEIRRWFFDENDRTSDHLVLPPEAWVVQPRIRYTFWRLRSDPSLSEAHRPFPRVVGAAIGIEVGLDYRTEAHEWGATDPERFDPADRRNPGEPLILLFRQWLRAGAQVHDRLRIQVAQFAGTGRHEDDLTRVRLGGLNPYVVPLAGSPWAGMVAGTFIAAEISLHVRIWRELELGVLGQGAALEDLDRTGDGELDMVGGLGAFADLRFGAFQIDLRAGWTPSLRAEPLGHWNVFAAFGWQWRSAEENATSP